MSELKFGPIKNKMKEVEVEGQGPIGCYIDCMKSKLVGNKKPGRNNCKVKNIYSPTGSTRK